MHRFFESKSRIEENPDKLMLSLDNGTHMIKVLRMGAGDRIILCDGEGRDFLAQITETSKEIVFCRILDSFPNAGEGPVRITLFQCVPKGDKMDFIVEKAVELGVASIVPVISARCVAKGGSHKVERWRKIALSAAKQSGRGIVPYVAESMSLQESLQAAGGGNLDHAAAAVEWERERHIKAFAKAIKPGDKLGIFIGPEGGFDPEEGRAFAEREIIPVSLGGRILRTETAGLFVLSVIHYQLEGDICD